MIVPPSSIESLPDISRARPAEHSPVAVQTFAFSTGSKLSGSSHEVSSNAPDLPILAPANLPYVSIVRATTALDVWRIVNKRKYVFYVVMLVITGFGMRFSLSLGPPLAGFYLLFAVAFFVFFICAIFGVLVEVGESHELKESE